MEANHQLKREAQADFCEDEDFAKKLYAVNVSLHNGCIKLHTCTRSLPCSSFKDA